MFGLQRTCDPIFSVPALNLVCELILIMCVSFLLDVRPGTVLQNISAADIIYKSALFDEAPSKRQTKCSYRWMNKPGLNDIESGGHFAK